MHRYQPGCLLAEDNYLAMTQRGIHATLSLHFRKEANHTTTRLDACIQDPPLRVVRGFKNADGASLAHLHNLSGGVLGGDQLQLTIHVAANANAQVTSAGSTRIYRQRPGEVDSAQQTQVQVESGGLLEYLPDTLIPYARSRYRQRTQIELSHDAGLFYWEIITPGREALGELFEYEMLRLDLDIRAEGEPIASERMQLEPALRRHSSVMRLGHFRYFTSFYICRVGIPASTWLALETTLDESARQQSLFGEALWGVSTLRSHGIVLRGMGMNSRVLQRGLLNFWQSAKHELYGSEAILPRKIY